MCTACEAAPPGERCAHTRKAAAAALLDAGKLGAQHVHDLAQVLLDRHRGVGKLAGHAGDVLGVVVDLGLRELEAVRCADDDGAVAGRDDVALAQLDECRERDACVRAVEHAGPVRARGRVHQLLLRRLLHQAVAVLQGQQRAVDGHGVADLDGRRKRGLGLDGRVDLGQVLRLVAGFAVLERLVQRVGVGGLRHHQARQLVHQAQVLAHLEALVEGVDVAQVAARDDDPVGHLPVKLLQDLDRRRLLALQAQTVHRVGQVDGRLGRHLLDQAHAAVKVGVDGQHQRAVGDGLHQLRQRDLVRW
mmetsp:Transcript_16115/g.40127  ORF Transcript_16115/g.40127 Transcript_16115/m.40127 type:complete len:304 (-) Transcript_16115:793-1704(-)